MTYLEFATILKSIEIAEDEYIPVAYYQFTEATAKEPPFICYYYTNSNDLMADDTNYQKIRPVTVELYTDNKNFALEAIVEAAFVANNLTFTRQETYIESERMYMVSYYLEVIVNG